MQVLTFLRNTHWHAPCKRNQRQWEILKSTDFPKCSKSGLCFWIVANLHPIVVGPTIDGWDFSLSAPHQRWLKSPGDSGTVLREWPEFVWDVIHKPYFQTKTSHSLPVLRSFFPFLSSPHPLIHLSSFVSHETLKASHNTWKQKDAPSLSPSLLPQRPHGLQAHAKMRSRHNTPFLNTFPPFPHPSAPFIHQPRKTHLQNPTYLPKKTWVLLLCSCHAL